jgi:hypothetical protein
LVDDLAYHDGEQVLVTPHETHSLRARADCLRGEGWGLAYWQATGSVVVGSLYEESTTFTIGDSSGGKITAYLGAVPKVPFIENPLVAVRTVTQTSILWLTSVSMYYVGETHVIWQTQTQIATSTQVLTSTQVVNTTETSIIFSTQVVNSTQTVNATQTVTVTETTTVTNSTAP